MRLDRIAVGPYGTNCYIFCDDSKRCWIIDPGNDGETIISHVEQSGCTPQAVLLTHGHWDHVIALGDLRKHWPEIPILIHPADARWLGPAGGAELLEQVQEFDPSFAHEYHDKFLQLPASTGDLVDNQLVPDSGFRVIHTPGHTPGSICLYHEGGHILLSGDTMFASGAGRTDLEGGDYLQLQQSLKKLKSLPADVQVFPGHGVPTTIAREQRTSGF